MKEIDLFIYKNNEKYSIDQFLHEETKQWIYVLFNEISKWKETNH